jgi:hypothetical protein
MLRRGSQTTTMLVEVSERELKKFLKKSDDFESMSTITRLMNIGNELKEAGLQPVFFIDSETEIMMVTTEERISKKLH